MATETLPLRMFFFPFVSSGHLIPMLDMAMLFSEQGVRVTLISTPINASFIAGAVEESSDHQIDHLQLHFPTSESAALPEECHYDHVAVNSSAVVYNCSRALTLLRHPFRRLLQSHNPDCVVSDMFLPWTADVATELHIPRLVFHGVSVFYLCVKDSITRFSPHKDLIGDDDAFVVPCLPHRILMKKSELPEYFRYQSANGDVMNLMTEIGAADAKSYGVMLNSFYEMEKDHTDHLRKVMGRKAWHIGPLNLCNQRKTTQHAEIAGKLKSWLDSNPPNSVLYVCFGSLSQFSRAQLGELALGLESSGHSFIWVVRGSEPGWEPEGFEERVGTRGVLVREWAPQVQILSHPAVGGFVTHCGWNSVLEGVSAGVPLIAWPLFADQFYNAKLVLHVLEVGVSAGATVWAARPDDRPLIRRVTVEMAVRKVMDGGDEAEAMRSRVRRLGEMARIAVGKEGSSRVDLGRVIEDLVNLRGSASQRTTVGL